jgi:hypothetical protein
LFYTYCIAMALGRTYGVGIHGWASELVTAVSIVYDFWGIWDGWAGLRGV